MANPSPVKKFEKGNNFGSIANKRKELTWVALRNIKDGTIRDWLNEVIWTMLQRGNKHQMKALELFQKFAFLLTDIDITEKDNTKEILFERLNDAINSTNTGKTDTTLVSGCPPYSSNGKGHA